MKKDGSTGFWEPGFSIFVDELGKQEKAQLAPLQAELKTVTDPTRRDELNRQIAEIKAQFKTKRKNARYSLFAKS